MAYTYYSNFQSQAVLSTAPGHVCFKLMLQTMFRPDGGMLGIFIVADKNGYIASQTHGYCTTDYPHPIYLGVKFWVKMDST